MEEEEIILDVRANIDEALTNIIKLKDANTALRKTIAEEKDELAELDKVRNENGALTEEQSARVDDLRKSIELQNAQIKENTQYINANTKVVNRAVEERRGEIGSINELRKQSASLTAEYSALSRAEREGARGDEIKKHLADINAEINSAMLSVNNFKDNVGNYRSALAGMAIEQTKLGGVFKAVGLDVDALAKGGSDAKQAFAGVGNTVKSVGGAFKALVVNPYFIAITGLAAIFMAIKDAIGRSEDQTNRLQSAFAKFKPVVDLVQNAFTKLADVALTAIDGILSGFGKVVEIGARVVDTIAGAFGHETKLEEGVKSSVKNAEQLTKLEQDLAKKRRAFMIEEAEAQRDIAELRANAQAKDKFTASERLKFMESALAKEKDIADKRLQIAKDEYKVQEQESARAENDAEANEALARAKAEMANAEREHFEQLKKLEQSRASLINEINAEQTAREKERKAKADARAKAEADAIKASEEATKALIELERKQAEERAKIQADTSARTLSNRLKELEQTRAVLDAQTALEKEAGAQTIADIQEYERARAELEKQILDTRKQQQEAERAQRVEEVTQNDLLDEQTKLDAIAQLNEEYRLKNLDLETAYNDALKQNSQKTASDIEAIEKQSADRRAKIQASTLTAIKGAFSGLSDILSSYGEENKKAFEVNKKVQIATTLISTYESAQKAYDSLSSIPYVGPALGAVAAAGAVASGLARVRSIQKTSWQSGATSGASETATASATTAVSTASATTSATTTSYGRGDYTQYDRGATATVYDTTTNATDVLTRGELLEAIQSQPAPIVKVADINETQNEVEARRTASIL